ncbi:malto-oligosyltrehalose synthase [Microbacterium kribbense]|uniref:Malto-oligosyltrehalose synthase n=1 Tax=Microbacterium kribbense TaxID=433645 RepID=A0ABP7FYT9_9MICO
MPLPTSTYRLQITSAFDLDAAAGLCGYLADLGVGWVYLSPLLRAEPGSNHGYDVIDHTTIDPERGGPAAFERFVAAARANGLGVLVDIVPNHMGVATPARNAWWWDLLKAGRTATHAEAFDVDWAAGSGRVRIPVLADGAGELDLLRVDGDELAYYDNRYPIAAGTRGDGDSGAQVHDRQHYELINWRRADDDLNYRRFFAVNSLAAIRVEDPTVFDASHVEIGRWFQEGLVDGLRVDHPDGLADPREYLDALARLTTDAPVWVEKILEGAERLPANWATRGTTGYDALGDVDRVLIDPAGQDGLRQAVCDLSGPAPADSWANLIHDTKRGIADGILRSEMNRLARLMPTVDQATDALIELAACFPVYRSYLPLGAEDLARAHADAAARRPDLRDALADVVALLGDPTHPAAVRFQQTSGMVMAKGVEDTAFYRWSTLSSLAEVGADPSEFSIEPDQFHARQARRQAELPHSMTTLSTHDTKRSEDVRARIDALAERPELWRAALAELHRAADLGEPALENLLWQAVIGAWPASRERLHGYAEKAARESGTQTSWTAPNAQFEARMHAAIDAAFDDPQVRAVIEGLVDEIQDAGRCNSLTAKLLQLAAPGIPDVYQGSELWERSLVDPDNRRPVDFTARAALLQRLDEGWLPRIDETGAAKLLVTSRALRLRRDHPERFGAYRALPVYGAARSHALAFDRGGAVAVGTRLPWALGRDGGWRDTCIEPAGTHLVDVVTGREFTGGRILLAELLERYPVALLTAPVAENAGRS